MSENTPVSQGVFVHRYVHNLDPKKRLTIPSEWRDQVGEPPALYLLPGIPNNCIYAYPARDFGPRLERVRSRSIADTRARQFARSLGSRSDLVAWDGQGRIRVKDELLAYAGLVDQVVLIGALDLIEIWSPENWEATGSMEPDSFTDAAEYVGF